MYDYFNLENYVQYLPIKNHISPKLIKYSLFFYKLIFSFPKLNFVQLK